MFVSLKIPDATAITALRTLKEMGYKELQGLTREIYYLFEISSDDKKFRDAIAKVDILVNANKHTVSFEPKKKGVSILVEDMEHGEGLTNTLKHRLGFNEILSCKQGVLWTFDIKGAKAQDLAKKMTEELLANIHYQRYKVMNK